MKELSALPDDQVSFHGALKEVSTSVRSSYVEAKADGEGENAIAVHRYNCGYSYCP